MDSLRRFRLQPLAPVRRSVDVVFVAPEQQRRNERHDEGDGTHYYQGLGKRRADDLPNLDAVSAVHWNERTVFPFPV